MFELELSKPQSEFIQLEDKYPLFVAGFGSGKSTIQCASIFNDLSIPHYEVMKIGAYAPTYDLLKLITIPYLCEYLEEMKVGFKLNKSDYILTLESDDEIILRSLDNPARIVGYQTFRAHIDEIDTLVAKKAKEAWQKVIARNRQKIAIVDDQGELVLREDNLYKDVKTSDGGIEKILIAEKGSPKLQKNRVSAYTNPEGFGFAYETWFKEKKKSEESGYAMIKASTYSNIKNLPDDYIETLMASYPDELVEAYINGDFVNLIGKSVYPKFDRELHNSEEEVRQGDILEVGMDFNVVHGASVIHVLRNGDPVAVDEIHDSYDTDEQIAILKARYPGHVVNVYPDATGDRRTSANTTESDLAKLRGAGFKLFHNSINPPIKDRVMSYNAMLMNGKKQIRYKVNTKKCPNLTNSLEQQIWGPNGLPDKSNGLDHIVDGGGYYVSYRFGITKPTLTTTTTHARY